MKDEILGVGPDEGEGGVLRMLRRRRARVVLPEEEGPERERMRVRDGILGALWAGGIEEFPGRRLSERLEHR